MKAGMHICSCAAQLACVTTRACVTTGACFRRLLSVKEHALKAESIFLDAVTCKGTFRKIDGTILLPFFT
jgi:hypothetical protein